MDDSEGKVFFIIARSGDDSPWLLLDQPYTKCERDEAAKAFDRTMNSGRWQEVHLVHAKLYHSYRRD